MKSPVLAIETSCDECSASVVTAGTKNSTVKVLSNVIFSQIEIHGKFGGIVPEVASRNHLEMFSVVVDEALEKASVGFKDLSAIAVTQRPGLIGALLVGVSAAKSYSYSLGIPLVPVHHLEGHLHSIFIEGQKNISEIKPEHFPMLVCLVSGGHTNLYVLRDLPPKSLGAEKISESIDDAAGEAFDKCAKLLGLPYPGGIHLDRISQTGDPKAFSFPRPLPGKNMDFSFSGLKTSVQTELLKQGFGLPVFGKSDPSKHPTGQLLANFCASVQEAIVQTLFKKINLGIEHVQAKSLAIVGGVSANSRLRALINEKMKCPVFIPDSEYCTDNAAMIGASGYFHLQRGEVLQENEILSCNAFSS